MPIVNSVIDIIIVNGFTGVSLLFVISGFVFTLGLLQSERTNWKYFYLNRLLRIYPLYLLINLCAIWLQPNSLPLRQFLLNLVGLGNFRSGYGIFDTVLWTISVLIQFYLLLPILISTLRRHGIRWLWGLLTAMNLLRLGMLLNGVHLHDLVYWSLIGRLDQFIIGIILAWYCYKRNWLGAGRTSTRILGMGLVASSLALISLLWVYTNAGWKYGESYLQIVWPSLEGLVWAATGICFVGLARRLKPRFLKPLELTGVISYSLYILQYPIIKLLQQAGWAIELDGQKLLSGILSATLIYLPITIVSSIIAYRIIEKPPLKLRKLYAKPKP